MTTKRKTDIQKTRGAFARAFIQLAVALHLRVRLPIRINWRMVLMPWTMLPHSVAFALIGLVALAMVLDVGSEGVTIATSGATIGGTEVPSHLDCAEDESIAFVGIPDTLVCVHVDNFAEQDAHGCTRPAFYSGSDVQGERCTLSNVGSITKEGSATTPTVPPLTAPTVTPTIGK